MRINKNYILQKIVDEYIVVPVGEAAGRMRGIIKLNETGAFLWSILSEKETLRDELIRSICAEYSVNVEIAKTDVDVFLGQLRDMGALIDE